MRIRQWAAYRPGETAPKFLGNRDWTSDANAVKLGAALGRGTFSSRNGFGPSLHPTLEIAHTSSRIRFLLCGDAGVSVWNRDELRRRYLVRPRRDSFHRQGQPDRNFGDPALIDRPSVRRCVD